MRNLLHRIVDNIMARMPLNTASRRYRGRHRTPRTLA